MDKAEASVIMKEVSRNKQQRTDGDGMESHKVALENKILIPLPAPHTTKGSQHVATNDSKNAARCSMKKKEPKFVPYEPYKAAVSLIIPSEKLNVDLQQCKSLKDSLYLCTMKHVEKPEQVVLSGTVNLNQCKCQLSDSNQVLEEKIKCLQQENATLENQLKIQTQVNHDLKKLLVASVGEDMQTKVQFLTEDKTKLAYDIVHYSQKLMEDSEHLDKLSIQCDVWRSKFLASSVMVDELAGWKAVLGHQLSEALDIIKLLLDEQEKLNMHSRKALLYLKSMNEKCEKDISKNMNATKACNNGLEVALENETTVRLLHEKLFGPVPVIYNHKRQNKKTPGEQLGYQFLSNCSLCHCLNPESHFSSALPMCALSHFYRGTVPRFHPSTQYDRITFNCCHHCQGDIKLL